MDGGREFIWKDLGEIEDPNVRREARQLFRNTMSLAEAIERDSPEKISAIVIEGIGDLINYLEANDVGGHDSSSSVE